MTAISDFFRELRDKQFAPVLVPNLGLPVRYNRS